MHPPDAPAGAARRMALRLASGAAALLTALCAPAQTNAAQATSAQAASAPAALTNDDAAHCIAVMQDRADELAQRIKAGDPSQEPALRSELLRAAALAAGVYFSGMQDGAVAKEKLKQAHAQQQSWDAQRKARLRDSCLRSADAELAGASSTERFIVERVAQARYTRMLKAR